MEKRITERYNDEIMAHAAARYGVAVEDLTALDGFESYIYEYSLGGAAYILRVAHSIRRSPDQIRGEVDWINYLAANGVRVARAVESVAGQLVELVDDGQGGQFLATAFVKAPGAPPNKENWKAPLFEHCGQQIGMMHRLTQDFRPADPAWKRPELSGDIDVAAWLPESEGLVLEKYEALIAYLDTLPKGRDNYGLIHQDAHGGNYFVDEAGQITFFDFDDSLYGWFAYDVAMVLFYAVIGREDAAEFGREFMRAFLTGYRREMTLAADWLVQIPYFLKLREIDLYAVIHRSFDVENLDDDPWVQRFMRGRKQMIENDVPVVEMDWAVL